MTSALVTEIISCGSGYGASLTGNPISGSGWATTHAEIIEITVAGIVHVSAAERGNSQT